MLGTMPRPRKPKADLGPKRNRSFRLPEVILDLLEEVADEERRKATVELQIALEEHLKKKNKWPPPPRKP